MKILFITHTVGIYGASRSLQLLLNNLSHPEHEVHMVVNKRLVGKNNHQLIRNNFGPHVQSIKEFHLPFALDYEGAPQINNYQRVKRLLWKSNKRKLYKYIQEEKFDIIYLNSLSLYELISERFQFLIHVREICKPEGVKNVMPYLQHAKGIIFIDEATAKPFKNSILPEHTILNNPFDQTVLANLGEPQLKLPIPWKDHFIISAIGQVDDNKGILFIMEAFIKAGISKTHLVIVGNTLDEEYRRKCELIAKSSEQITFYGEESSINHIYLITDCIIRGEKYPCVGRTTYEGLYSGCYALVPGGPENAEMFFEFDTFHDKIRFYQPRNEQLLIEQLKEVALQKPTGKNLRSNISGYMISFLNFATRIIK